MKEIDFTEFNEKTPKNANILVNNIVCSYCGKLFSKNAKALRTSLDKKKGKQWEGKLYCCVSCFNKDVHNYSDWIKHNSEAQKIAQNKPEQKLKNSEGVKRSRQNPEIYAKWRDSLKNVFTEEYKEKMCKIITDKWNNNEEYRNNVLSNNKFYTSCHGIFHSKFSGNIRYESSYELMFIFLKELEKKEVKRFDIKLEYEYNKSKKYYVPDFVCDNIIYEIKSHAILKKKGDSLIFEAKKKAAKKFIEESDIYNGYEVIFEEWFGKKKLKAREYIFSWLIKDGYISDNFGGNYMITEHYYLDNNYISDNFLYAKELYTQWNSLK